MMHNSTTSAHMPPTELYTEAQLRHMNATPLWNSSISVERPKDAKACTLYRLCPTGYADVNGRKYIALPMTYNTASQHIREKYNLI